MVFENFFVAPSWKPGEPSGSFVLTKYDENFATFMAELYGKLPNDSMIQNYMKKKEILTFTRPSPLNSKWKISVKGGKLLSYALRERSLII